MERQSRKQPKGTMQHSRCFAFQKKGGRPAVLCTLACLTSLPLCLLPSLSSPHNPESADCERAVTGFGFKHSGNGRQRQQQVSALSLFLVDGEINCRDATLEAIAVDQFPTTSVFALTRSVFLCSLVDDNSLHCRHFREVSGVALRRCEILAELKFVCIGSVPEVSLG